MSDTKTNPDGVLVKCPDCGEWMRLPAWEDGLRVACPKCGRVVVTRKKDASPPLPAPAALAPQPPTTAPPPPLLNEQPSTPAKSGKAEPPPWAKKVGKILAVLLLVVFPLGMATRGCYQRHQKEARQAEFDREIIREVVPFLTDDYDFQMRKGDFANARLDAVIIMNAYKGVNDKVNCDKWLNRWHDANNRIDPPWHMDQP
jgi:hypothetical protein